MQPPGGAKRICQVCLEMQYFKTAVLRRGAENNGLAVFASAAAIKGIEPINRWPLGYGLSALRLCVRLFDSGHISFFKGNKS